MSNPLQAVPTYSQWKTWQAKLQQMQSNCNELVGHVVCLFCHTTVILFRDNTIRVGCRVKVWNEEVTETPDGEVVKLTSKIVPMNMTGPGCPLCQYLMTKLESEELTRYDKECREWQELHKPAIQAMRINIRYNDADYFLVKDAKGSRWFNMFGMRVPTIIESGLFRHYATTCEQHIVAGLEPWMRALGMTAPPYTPQPDSRTRTPSKRQVYIDVTEDVLQMPRAKRREDDIPAAGVANK